MAAQRSGNGSSGRGGQAWGRRGGWEPLEYGQGEGEGTRSRRTNGERDRLAGALGWFSLGLGLAETLAPARVAHLIGVRNTEGTRALLRLMGLREMASGIGIVSRPAPAGWVWARVGGDFLDLALLRGALQSPRNDERRLAIAMAAVAGVAALDIYKGRALTRRRSGHVSERERESSSALDGGTLRVKKAITINRSPEEVYQFWKDFPSFPRFMRHLASVELLEGRRSRWKAKAPAGTSIEWDAEILEDEPYQVISWGSVEGSGVENRGSVHFRRAPGGRGTEVRLELQYDVPGGRLTSAIRKLFGEDPGEQAEEDLRVAKQLLEIGEVVRSEGAREGRIRQRPARPLEGEPRKREEREAPR